MVLEYGFAMCLMPPILWWRGVVLWMWVWWYRCHTLVFLGRDKRFPTRLLLLQTRRLVWGIWPLPNRACGDWTQLWCSVPWSTDQGCNNLLLNLSTRRFLRNNLGWYDSLFLQCTVVEAVKIPTVSSSDTWWCHDEELGLNVTLSPKAGDTRNGQP